MRSFTNAYLWLCLLSLSTIWSSIDCRPNTNQRPICKTEVCKKTAQMILNNMDETTDPCDDFYQYACGGFISKNQTPDNKTSTSLSRLSKDLVKRQIKESLESTESDPTESESWRKGKHYYLACMDTEAIEKLGISEVLKDFQELGGWPVIEGDAWKEEEFDWPQTILKLEELGYNTTFFFKMFLVHNSTYTKENQLVLMSPNFYLTSKTPNHILRAYSRYIKDLAKFFGAKEERVNKELKEVIRFEIQMAKIFLLKDVNERVSLTLREVNERFPYFPWLDYINVMSGSNNFINESEIINVLTPKYLEKFGRLSAKTSKRVLANFLFTKTLLDIVDYLPKDFLKRSAKYQAQKDGKYVRPPRKETCLQKLEEKFKFAINNLYVKKYFKMDAREVVTVMVNQIFESASQNIVNTTWIDNKTRESALAKLTAMLKTVAYPDEILDDEKIDEFYKDIIVTEKKYFMSSLSVNKFFKKFQFSRWKTPLPRGDWRNSGLLTRVNAFYTPLYNSLTIPAGILQGAFFDADRPQYMNFGAIGMVIGHEITHAFDNTGITYDKDGNLANWWTPGALEEFNRRRQCMIEQYSNVTVPEVGKNLNGFFNLGENIADNGGLKVAYAAYSKWSTKNDEEPWLPGIDLSPKQLFWVSNANFGCKKSTKDALEKQIETDVHSPVKYRVNVRLGNSKDFIRDFQCKEGTKMNPSTKCSVW